MQAPSGRDPAPLRVVIVDDVEDVRLVLRLEFELDGRFEVVGEGVDGDEAIELARTLQPDLLVLDRNMPGRGGIEAIAPVREVAPDTAIVLYTAGFDDTAHHTALAAGALDVLDKAGGPKFIDRFTAKLLDRAANGTADVEVRVGPTSGKSARLWIANSKRILAAVTNHRDLVEVPDDALALFWSLLDRWDEVAQNAEEFLWVARAARDDVARIVEQWSVIDGMTDEQLTRLGVEWSPPDARPFFEALTAGVLRALERDDESRRLAARLVEQWAPYRQGSASP